MHAIQPQPHRHLLACAVALCLWAGPGTSAQAANMVQLFVSPSFSGGIGAYGETLTDDGPLLLNGVGADDDLSSGTGMVFTDLGVIKSVGRFTGSGHTLSRGRYSDTLVFNWGNLPVGTNIEVSYAVLVEGLMAVSAGPGNAVASWNLRMDLGGGNIDLSAGGALWNPSPSHVNSGNVGYIGDAFGLYTATATVQIGRPETLAIRVESAAQASFSNGFSGITATAEFDLGGSSYWAGIREVRHNGTLLTDYTVTSTSGKDWRASMVPVPEPPIGVLTLAGLALLGLWRRRMSWSRCDDRKGGSPPA